MKLLIIFVLIGFIGVAAQSSPTTDATETTTFVGTSDATATTDVVTGGGVTGASTDAATGSTDAATGSTDASNTGSTVENTNPPATTLASTIPPTTTPPLKRDVSFNIDCTTGTQCSFQFKIAEPLMRFVNTTVLESVLTNLTSKINDLNQASSALTTEEQTYITTLQSEIDGLNNDVTNLNENLNGTLSDAQTLQDATTNAANIAQKYLAAAICFRNDLQPSEACGEIAFGSS